MATLAYRPLGSAYRIPVGSTVYTSPTAYPNATTEQWKTDRPGMPPPILSQVRQIVVLDPGASTERVVLLDSRGVAFGAVYATSTWLGVVNGTARMLNASIYGSLNDWPLLSALTDLATVYGWTSATQE